MDKRLEGKVAVVTGSTSGIGRASAELFAEQGASVVINGRRRELGQEVVEGITAAGGTASYFYADVSRSEEVVALIEYAVETYGRIDVLMNNAYSGRSASVIDIRTALQAGWNPARAPTGTASSAARTTTEGSLMRRNPIRCGRWIQPSSKQVHAATAPAVSLASGAATVPVSRTFCS